MVALSVFGGAATAVAEPADPAPPPPPTLLVPPPEPPPKNPMTPHQAAVPVSDPARRPDRPEFPAVRPGDSERPIRFRKVRRGVLGTLRDLWDQARNRCSPRMRIMGGAPAGRHRHPVRGRLRRCPRLHLDQCPGFGDPSTSSGGGGGDGTPGLPPGYYPPRWTAAAGLRIPDALGFVTSSGTNGVSGRLHPTHDFAN